MSIDEFRNALKGLLHDALVGGLSKEQIVDALDDEFEALEDELIAELQTETK